MKLFCTLALAIVLFTVPSCIATQKSGGSGTNRALEGSTAGSEQDLSVLGQGDLPINTELPFKLTIGGVEVGSDLKINVPENSGTIIQLIGNSVMNGQAKVVDPAGSTIILGAWQSSSTQFYYKFPYGENHLVLTVNEKEYDVLVVTGAPEPSMSTVGCEGGYLDLRPNAKWEFEENREGEYTLYWTYTVSDWKPESDGSVSLKILTTAKAGVERLPERNTVLELVCRNGTVFINRAVETDQESEYVTSYDNNTVYMPTGIREGEWWQRQGILQIERKDGDTATYNITEKFTFVGKGKVTVKAGEFDADRINFRIERTGTGQSEDIIYEGVSWYVPGLGRILSQAEDLEGSPRLELVSFEGVAPR